MTDAGDRPPRRVGLIVALALVAIVVVGGIAWMVVRQATQVTLPGGDTVNIADLQAAARKVEDAAARIDRGDAPAVAAPDALKAYLPAAVAGFTRGEVSGSAESAAGLDAAEAEGRYARGASRLKLKVADLGGAGALAGMASALGVQSSKETATGYEKMGVVAGRMTHETYDRSSRSGEYRVLIGERFLVQASGDGVTMEELKAAVNAVDLSRLERIAKAG